MNTAARLGGYTATLAVAFGAAWGVGTAVGTSPAAPAPVTSTTPAAGHDHGGAATGGAAGSGTAGSGTAGSGTAGSGTAGSGTAGSGHEHSADASTAAVVADGLTATAAGYTLVPQRTTFSPGEPAEFTFAVTGSDGRPVTDFDVSHERELHLIVVRRDTAGYQHLHPARGPDGVWRVPLTLPAGGVYRAYADFVASSGPELTLGVDLFAPGDFAPVPFPPSRVAQVDGYQIRLDGELVPGAESQVFATISRDGVAVTDLEPYLGAFGHLVALRGSDLAYLHVHPDGGPPAAADRSGPGIAFTADVPSAGTYRLFLDFQHGGVVRTAEFTVTTTGS